MMTLPYSFEVVYDAELDMFVREGTNDRQVILDSRRDYSLPAVSREDIVLDLGAHIGSASRVFLAQGAGVLSVEPDPANFCLLSTNLQGFRRAAVQRAAVMPEGTTHALLHRRLCKPTNNVTFEISSGPDAITVSAISLEYLLKMQKPTAIKCDIEREERALPAWGIATFANVPST